MKAETLFHIDAIEVQPVAFSVDGNCYNFSVLRLDKTHPSASGNKFFKLKYNVFSALQRQTDTILTFGGAHSNHIQATSSVCNQLGLNSIGLIRGEAPKVYSKTLLEAERAGMKLVFISRQEYKEKNEDYFKAWLRDEHGSFHLVPEGGSNFLGVQGCMEIAAFFPEHTSSVFLAAGTGATASGILLSSDLNIHVVSALKGGEFLEKDMANQIYWATMSHEMAAERMENLSLHTNHHYGGYAKFTPELISLLRSFHGQTHIPLEPVYTGKALACLVDEIKSGAVPNDGSALLIHTGGLQGIQGIEQRMKAPLF